MAKRDPAILSHLEWIGFVRPTGLVVSAPALVRAGAILDRRDAEGQQLLRALVEERVFAGEREATPWLPDFRAFATSVLGWGFSVKGYAGTADSPIPPEIEVPLPDYNETLRPDFAVREPEAQNGRPPWQLLVRIVEPGYEFDRPVRGDGHLEASAHGRMERLLRRTGVPAGLLFNGRALRLVSAPHGESSGWLEFRVADMLQTAGRPISTALRLLLSQSRLLSLPRAQRLTALLDDSRKFQNEVSERLAEQVLHALYELLRGFQAAHDGSGGTLLRTPLDDRPDEVYRALLTVVLRLVFLLFAEERDMLPEDETYLRHYSLAGLYERLREDAALFPDTLDQRYGAWAQLLVLFRLVFDGAECGAMRLPKRHGVLFDPDRFKFLEGRSEGGARQVTDRIEPPRVPDGTIYRALEKLLVLDGERISYRALDVEQIGSVYETMMGFRLETASGRSAAIKAQKKQGAPTAIDLEALLAESPEKRDKWIADHADRKLTDAVKKTVKEAARLEDLHAALAPVIDLAATPDLVPKGAIVLQPSEERRRSGSHYTPRALTEPIVRTTLTPILARLRGPEDRPPTPEQILDLKVCDPAMGSGAFLVEACRQLGDALIEAWSAHGEKPLIPPDEDEVIFARRLVAQRCLYGVDRNPVAVDLAKVSLWLATLAREHALTFVDHALRHGDSLVGLSRKQIEAFQWEADAPRFQAGFETMQIRQHIAKVAELRQRIREADESMADSELRDLWDEAQFELVKVRLFGDLILAAFFEKEKPKEREAKRSEYAGAVVSREAERYGRWLEEWRHAEQPLAPFHWEIEFPEVFDRETPGFDAMVGNPPFLAGGRISIALGSHYLDWLKDQHPWSDGGSDMAAYFFLGVVKRLCAEGCAGLIATNTIAQGETRRAGLGHILASGGMIFDATTRYKWPGKAAVVASIVHLRKCRQAMACRLNSLSVHRISAFLIPGDADDEPLPLRRNAGRSFGGAKIYGQGFLLDPEEAAHFLREPVNSERIFPYIGGHEINSSPASAFQRYVINFGTLSLEQAERWPQLIAIIRERVKPERDSRSEGAIALRQQRYWWRFRSDTPDLREALSGLAECLAHSQVSGHLVFSRQPTQQVFSHTTNVFAFEEHSAFAILQSRCHEVWARLLGSSMKDDLRYTISSCFETFPFPENWETLSALEAAGKAYYEFRAALMVKNEEGLTKTYNRFHDPEERRLDILELRDLHAAMDRAVLGAYDWNDIPTSCEFIPDFTETDDDVNEVAKSIRYRWPDQIRDKVLARLLELNAERAREETRAGATVDKKKRRGKSSTKRARKSSQTSDLLA